MVCEECRHQCTSRDFLTLRNLCDHLYLDALALKHTSVTGGEKSLGRRRKGADRLQSMTSSRISQ